MDPALRLAQLNVDKAAAAAFAVSEKLQPFSSSWHEHDRHQLLFSARGTLRLEVGKKQWLLPPQRAAWVNRSKSHRVSSSGEVLLMTFYLQANLLEHIALFQSEHCLVFPVSPLVRELVVRGVQWGPEHDAADPMAQRLFVLCAELCAELARSPLPLWLPTGNSDEIQHAIAYTLQRLGEKLRQVDVARACGLSERSLTRRFSEETNMTWQKFLQHARLLRAAELLCEPGMRVTRAAMEVGFDSLAAFSRAFERLMGQTPKDFRQKMSTAEFRTVPT